MTPEAKRIQQERKHLQQVHGLERGHDQTYKGHGFDARGVQQLHRLDHEGAFGGTRAWQHKPYDLFALYDKEGEEDGTTTRSSGASR